MSLRFTETQVAELLGYVPGEERAELHTKPQPPTSRRRRASSQKKTRNPQAELALAVRAIYRGLVKDDFVGAIPGRRFEIDIALPELKIAVEVDGWEYHGKHKADFHRDRVKRNQLVLNGWYLLTFSASSVFQEMGETCEMIETLIQQRAEETGIDARLPRNDGPG